MGDGSSSQPEFKRPCIFKVHDGLRANIAGAKPDPYTPMLVSIGPYHSHSTNSNLEAMNNYKQLYADSLLEPGSVNDECKSNLLRALQYYDPPLPPKSTDGFVDMMLRDGCFIIGFLCGRTRNDRCDPLRQKIEINPPYPVMDVDWKISQICRDMMLLENQLPYFVLETLYDTIAAAKGLQLSTLEIQQSLWRKVIWTFNSMLPKPRRGFIDYDKIVTKEIKHLLHAAHIICRHPLSEEVIPENSDGNSDQPLELPQQQNTTVNKDQTITEPLIGSNSCLSKKPENSTRVLERMGSVVELQEAGVDFKKIGEVYKAVDLTEGDESPPDGDSCAFGVSIINKSSADDVSLFDIKFKPGRSMRIPCFRVEDSTETLFRNLIAYEQHSSDENNYKYFTDFTTFMDQLINSEQDVKILRVNGIIVNLLGDDKMVSDLFNGLNDGVLESRNFYYGGVSQDVINHCKPKWIQFKTMLKRNYFGNPWAIISTIAAALLLILAIAQTVLALLALLK